MSWSPVKGVQVVKHAIPIANSWTHWHPFHTLGLSSTTPRDSRGWQPWGRAQGGSNEPLYLGYWTPWPQLGGCSTTWTLVPFEVFIASILREPQACVCSPFSTWDSSDREGQLFFVSVRVGVLLRRSCHRTLLQCKAGNGKLLPIAYERYNDPVQVMQKHGHECIVSRLATRSQVGRHGLYVPWLLPRDIRRSKNAQNAETKHQSGAVPNPTTSLIGFND